MARNRSAIYARVSTSMQSTALQTDDARALVQARGWPLVAVFEDHGVSGDSAHRPGLGGLLAAARRGEIDVAVVWRLDRLSRVAQLLRDMVLELSRLGVRVVSCREPIGSIDIGTESGRDQLRIAATLAEQELALIRDRTKRGMEAARRRGVRIGRPPRRVDVSVARSLIASGRSMSSTAGTLGIGFGTLRRALARQPE